MIFKKKRKGSETEGGVGLYGKHPSAGDFLRYNASSPEVLSFDQWLSAAMATAQKVLPGFKRSYLASPPMSFLYFDPTDSRCRSALIGVMNPSRDQSGREFPLIIFAHLDYAPAAQHYQIMAHEPFLRQARRLLLRQDPMSRDELIEGVQDLQAPHASSLKTAEELAGQYLQQTSWIAAFSTMFGIAAPMQQGKALGTLRESVQAVRPGASLPRFGIRCPMGMDAAGNSALWLGILRRRLSLPLLPNLLWGMGSLLIYFSQYSTKALAALLDPEWQDDHICDLSTTRSGEASGRLPDEDRTLSFLVEKG